MNNHERLLRLADEAFAVKDDPRQLVVTEEVLKRLRLLHPATVAEQMDIHGPVAWILLIPTTVALMEQFLSGALSEKELYERTPDHGPYEVVYLCSALVLPEYRGHGVAKELTITALERIRKDHPIQALFNWPFSYEGAAVAEAVAERMDLPMRIRVR